MRSFWLQTVPPLSATSAIAAPTAPTDQDPFERAAARSIRSVRPEGGRDEGAATRLLETYIPHAAQGLADLISLPGRDPIPMPEGLQINDAGEWLVDGQPAAATAEGRAWLEDQQRRQDWGPAMALLLALARVPGSPIPGALQSSVTRAAAQPAPSEVSSRPPYVRSAAKENEQLFDRSNLDKVPDRPQFDLERYQPARGVPEHVQALANPENIERVNETVRRGSDNGGRVFFNTEPLRRDYFLAELKGDKGQQAYDTYMNLVGATSPGTRVGDNIRIASYYYQRWLEGLPPPAAIWDGTKWTLTERPPYPWGHVAQGLHGKKVKEVLERGGLSPINSPKGASYVENLRGNYQPITIDRHNARLWGVKDVRGRPVDVPPRSGYGFLERLQQEQASNLELAPAQYQASAWIGGAEQTGVRSILTSWLDSLEARVEVTARRFGLTKEETLRRFIRGELPLYSLGGAAATATTSEPVGEPDE